jgi:uncharacterized protein YbjT (DUF2867 family)
MMYVNERGPVLVTGGTGRQGGATARSLLAQNIPVHALVRNPNASGAIALRKLGARLVVGDLDDAASLRNALEGVGAVFSVQNPDFANLAGDTELVRAQNLIEAAVQEGVTHFVQTTVTGAGEHYRSAQDWLANREELTSMVQKGHIEDLVRDAGFPFWTILKPGFFMENIPFFLTDDRLPTAYDPATPVPVVASDDIGAVAAAVFQDRERFNRVSIELAGDVLTMPEVAAILSEVWDRKILSPYQSGPDMIAAGAMPQMVLGQEWANEVGMPARPEHARARGFSLMDLKTWADKHRPPALAGEAA